MASGAQRKKPQFFKVLSTDPFANQTIPKKFHPHIRQELRETATLVNPLGKFWHMKIVQNDEDIYFEEGWSGFAKSHGLEKYYFLVFRYEGNMIFNVKIFDTTCCLKDYSLVNRTLPMRDLSPHRVADPTTALAAQVPRAAPAQSVSLVSVPAPTTALCPSPSYVEIEESSNETDQVLQVPSEETGKEISGDFFVKSRKFANGRKKIQQEIIDVEESKGETEVAVDTVDRKRKLSNIKSDSTTKVEKKVISRKKETIETCPGSSNYNQFDKILTSATLKHNLMGVPRSFCLKNGLNTTVTMFLKRKLEGGGRILLKEWPVQFLMPPSNKAQFRKGWKDFARENDFKIGDKCSFELVSRDTLVVTTLQKMAPEKLTLGVKEEIVEKGSDSLIGISKKKNELVTARTVSKSSLERKTKMSPEMNSRRGKNRTDKAQTWTFVRPYHLTYNYMTLLMAFCKENMLTSRREMILKNSEGKEWHVNYYLNMTKEGRLCGLGWRTFSEDYGLKVGDKCDFKLISEDTMLVHVLKEI